MVCLGSTHIAELSDSNSNYVIHFHVVVCVYFIISVARILERRIRSFKTLMSLLAIGGSLNVHLIKEVGGWFHLR